MNLDAFLGRVDGERVSETRGKFRCPVHGDNIASATCTVTEDGKLLIKCHVGCDWKDILRELGLTAADLFPPREKIGELIIERTYDYCDETGDLLFQKVRCVPKDFRIRRPFQGSWAWALSPGTYAQGKDGHWRPKSKKTPPGALEVDLPGTRKVLYRLGDILAAPADALIFLVEGEKDVENLRLWGLVATTNYDGASTADLKPKWRREYTAVLKGRRVVCLPDNDDAGRAHMANASKQIGAVATLALPDLPVKGDVSDWIKAGGTKEDFLALVDEALAHPAHSNGVNGTNGAAHHVGDLFASGSSNFITDETPKRPLQPRSYHSCVTIIQGNKLDVLEGRTIELNEMSGRPTLNRVDLKDADAFRLRYLIEERFSGGSDGRGLRFSIDDIKMALIQVASSRKFHPVRDYLTALQWDGRERIAYLPDLAGAQRTALNQAIFRRWMIGAVARPIDPGCKMDTMLVLIGKQGIFKSTFFKALAFPWCLDTPIDVHSKDAYMTISQSWVLEMAELESLLRARDAAAVKSFLSQASDDYRRPWGHFVERVPRAGVIVGTTNTAEFLSDETGSRRFWPVEVSQVDLDAVSEQRDQLWAEAVALYRAKEQWWLTQAESMPLAEIHAAHTVTDAWESTILTWADARRLIPFTTADVLEKAVTKPTGQWSRSDEMRVARVLRMNGWAQSKPNRGGRTWSKDS